MRTCGLMDSDDICTGSHGSKRIQNRYEVSILVIIWGAYLQFLDRDSEKADRKCGKKRGI